MKRLLLCFLLLALIALATVWYQMHHGLAPAICVEMRSPNDGGDDYLPAVDGYVSGSSSTSSDGKKETYRTDESYKVLSTTPGHFAVVAHYVIERDGVTTPVDRLLEVYDKKPDPAQWTKLDNQLVAFAYVSESTIPY